MPVGNEDAHHYHLSKIPPCFAHSPRPHALYANATVGTKEGSIKVDTGSTGLLICTAQTLLDPSLSVFLGHISSFTS